MNNRKNVYLMYLIVFFQGFVFYGPVATLYRQARGVSLSQIFLIESISWILMILFEVPWGWFADRFGYKKTLVISNFIFFISKIVFFKSTSFAMFLFERVLLSLSISGLSGCDATLLYISAGENENSERIFARYEWFATIGFLIATSMSTLLIKKSMDATAFYTIIFYGIAFALTVFLDDVKTESEVKPNIKVSIKNVLKNKMFIIYVIAYALIGDVVQSITVFLNQGQYVKSGIDIKYFGILLALIQIIRLISVKSYKLSNKLGKDKAILLLFVVITLGAGILIRVSTPILSVLMIAMISGSMAIIQPISMDMQNKSISTGDRATILSLYSMCGSMISAVINPLVGVASDKSLELGLTVCFAIGCIGCLLMYYFVRINK